MGAHPAHNVKADGARCGTLGFQCMAGRLSRILRHEFFKFCLDAFMFLVRGLGGAEADRKFSSAVGRTYVDGSNRLKPLPRRFDLEQARRLAVLHSAPFFEKCRVGGPQARR